MPLNLVLWIMAALPIALLMILMVGYQWGATKAAPFGLLVALFSAFVFFKANVTLINVEILKGLWSSFSVLVVVWPAILLYEVVSEAKAFNIFREGLKKVTPNELIQLFALGWVFMSFLQGITGFGVPVAVGAPLLVGIGVKPLWAVFIPLIGHAWGNTFGTLAVAWDALASSANLDPSNPLYSSTALWAAAFIWVWNVITGISIAWVYGGKKAIVKGWPAIIIISLIQGGGQLILSQINTTIAAFLPSVLSLVAIIALSKMKRFSNIWSITDSKIMQRDFTLTENSDNNAVKKMSIHQAFFPYYFLTVITLIILLISPIRKYLGQVKVGFSFPETSTGYGYINSFESLFLPISPLTHAGIFLLLSSVVGFLFYYKKRCLTKKSAIGIIKRSFNKTLPSAVAVIGFILMSRVMGGTGQTVVLAKGIAKVMGSYYAIFASVIGVLGSFMTSSNMASNILFGQFQLTTSSILGLNTAAVLGAQTAGGAIGNTICPGNIILGTTTAGILGQEGVILKKILPLAMSVALIVGLILFFATGI